MPSLSSFLLIFTVLAGFLSGVLLIVDCTLRAILLGLRLISKKSVAAGKILPINGAIILIAARDEAGVIGQTVDALVPQLREWNDARLWIVADNCTDGTAAEALREGVNVAVRSGGKSGKGAVLDWWLTTHKSDWKSGEIIIVLDADSRIQNGTLLALKNAFETGADAAQAFVKPLATTQSGRLAGWSEVLMQLIDDTARTRYGWQIPLRGTGMAIKAELLAELAPKLHTLAEDLELDVLLAKKKSNVKFVSEAVIFDPKPQKERGVANQRARWFRGQFQVLKSYWHEIFFALRNSGASAWFLLPLLFLRPKILLMGSRATVLITTLTLLFTSITNQLFVVILLSFSLLGLCFDAIYYLTAAQLISNRKEYLRDLLAAPRYVLIWILGFSLMLVKRGWLRAGR